MGDPSIRVAVLDGPVDLTHPCFADAHLRQLLPIAQAPVSGGRMSSHGTHVASVLFGQPDSRVRGIAPRATGILVPVFRESEDAYVPQLDLARALQQAVDQGAQVVNISGGEPSGADQADPILQRVLHTCEEQNVLVVAAAGNDGCACLHVPAAVPSVLAVGALGRTGAPLPSSNWGGGYESHGVMALGQSVEGASPDGGTRRMSGTSFATPVVAGVAALLLDVQRTTLGRVDPAAVRTAILASSRPCGSAETTEPRCLAGILDIEAAYQYLVEHMGSDAGVVASSGVRAAAWASAHSPSGRTSDSSDPGRESRTEIGELVEGGEATVLHDTAETRDNADNQAEAPPATSSGVQAAADEPGPDRSPPAGVTPACADEKPGAAWSGGDCGCGGLKVSEGGEAEAGAAATAAAVAAVAATPSYVYALGTVGFDFGTEARRDTFRQLMPDVQRDIDGTPMSVSPNPYDVFQLSGYLNGRPSESTKLIWTLNLDLTPIYALEAEITYPEDVYGTLRDALARQALPEDDLEHVARVSIPGVLTNRTVRLFSGQLLPIVVVQPRGLFEWNVRRLVDQVIDAIRQRPDTVGNPDFDEARLRRLVQIFLDKVYFECRNLGAAPPDRALNFAATNAFQFASGIAQGLISGEIVPSAGNSLYSLDSISVQRSPYCRMDSDCWDVLITWFDPENDRRAKSIFQFTIDVSDQLPVSLAPAHQYLAT